MKIVQRKPRSRRPRYVFQGEMLEQALIAGLLSVGIEVFQLG